MKPMQDKEGESIKMEYEERFISMLRGQTSLLFFESWLYENYEVLEKFLDKDSYFKLLDLNYKSKYVIEDLETLLVKVLGYNSVEDFKIRDLLYRLVLVTEDDEFISVCRRIYAEYCNGYNFFRLIALKYIVWDYDYQLRDFEARTEFLSEYRDEFINEGRRLISYFELGLIQITGEREYNDRRSKNDKIEEDYWK